MFELLRIAIALTGSVAAGIWDLKTGDVPDWVCGLMIAAGIALFSVEGFMTGIWSGLTTSMLIGALFAAFGLGMWLTGQWGGGDGELLTAIGVLLPIWPMTARSLFLLPLAFFINVFFVGAAYIVAYSAVLACTKPALRTVIGKNIKADSKMTAPVALGAVAATVALWFLTGSVWVIAVTMIAVGLPLLYRMLQAVEAGFSVRIPTSRLKAGDMLGEDILRLGLIKKHIRGLKDTEVKAIKKIKSYVLIRDGVRFSPVFLLALVVTLLVGDLATFILLQLM